MKRKLGPPLHDSPVAPSASSLVVPAEHADDPQMATGEAEEEEGVVDAQAIDERKCIARTWNGGLGKQCSWLRKGVFCFCYLFILLLLFLLSFRFFSSSGYFCSRQKCFAGLAVTQ